MPGEEETDKLNTQQKGNREKKIEANKHLQKKQKAVDQPRSSLSLQMLILLDYYFSLFYGIVTCILLIYKSSALPYPPLYFGLEFIFLLLFWLWQMMKISLGSRGNRTEKNSITLLFIIFNVPSIIVFLFFMVFQTYSLIIEVVMNILGILLCIFEIISGFMQFLVFRHIERSD
ncbi:unnamed protein product [Moneuplotes crassus]|uniref:Transmembrane protein n=1 Tax=Euplotes crassus TaxID=5936 RepID=A0AAD1Y2V5_EUPCR|nr:unnamed protein product [Moneuplotes crassus]